METKTQKLDVAPSSQPSMLSGIAAMVGVGASVRGRDHTVRQKAREKARFDVFIISFHRTNSGVPQELP